MLFEMAWKTAWILLIALPAWLSGGMTNGIENLFYDCVGVVVIYFAIPWRYVLRGIFCSLRSLGERWCNS